MSQPTSPLQQRDTAAYGQTLLIENLKKYFAAKTPSAELPFSSRGLCSGLAAYWMYCKRVGMESDFLRKLRYAINWDSAAALAQGQQEDPIMEEFINSVMLLQHDHKLREGVQQPTLDSSFALLLDDCYPRVNPAEYINTFVFSQNTLIDLLQGIVFPDKMIRIDNGLHTVGLMYSDGVYDFYNPNADEGPQKFDDLTTLIPAITNSLAKYCESKEYIALSFHIFDIAKALDYPNALDYRKSLLQDPDYKTAFITHRNIFHLALRMQDYQLLDLLYENGYQYIPWDLTNSTEIEEAVLDRDKKKLAYLIAHNVPIDYHNDNGLTGVGRAILAKANEMLYLLLAAKANPNLRPSKYTSTSYLLTQFNTPPGALILLLADGMSVNDDFMRLLKLHYTTAELEAILTHTLMLYAEDIFQYKISENVIKMLAEIVQNICKQPEYERTREQMQEHLDLLSNLQKISAIKSDVQKEVTGIRNQLAAYLREPATPIQPLIFTAIRSFEEDVQPLLNLKLKI